MDLKSIFFTLVSVAEKVFRLHFGQNTYSIHILRGKKTIFHSSQVINDVSRQLMANISTCTFLVMVVSLVFQVQCIFHNLIYRMSHMDWYISRSLLWMVYYCTNPCEHPVLPGLATNTFDRRSWLWCLPNRLPNAIPLGKSNLWKYIFLFVIFYRYI